MVTRLAAGQRRDQLLEVAVDLFSRKGFSGTTTREIASTAGVTEAVIFRHFATKEQLYTAIIDRKVHSPLFEEWMADLRAAMERDDDETVIRRLVSAIIQTHRIDPKFERLMLYAALERNEVALIYMSLVTESVVAEFRAYFSRRQKQGCFVKILPDAALSAIVGMAFHHAQKKYIHAMIDERFTDEDAIESFTRIALTGLRKNKKKK